MGKILYQSLIDEVQESVPRLNQGHFHIQGRKHRGIFHTDHPSTNDNQRSRNLRHLQKFITVQNGSAIKRNSVRPIGIGAGGNQNMRRRNSGDFSIVSGDFHLMRADEPRQTAHGIHMISIELMLKHVHLIIQSLMQAHLKIVRANLIFHAIGPPIKASLAPS